MELNRAWNITGQLGMSHQWLLVLPWKIYTFSITGTNTGAVTQQPYGHWDDRTLSQGVSELVEHEWRHQKCHKAVCHMPGISEYTTMREDNTMWGSIQALGGGCCWYFFFKKNRLLCIVDSYSKADSLAADDLFRAAKIIFAEFRLPKTFVSYVGTNFTSEIQTICGQMNI